MVAPGDDSRAEHPTSPTAREKMIPNSPVILLDGSWCRGSSASALAIVDTSEDPEPRYRRIGEAAPPRPETETATSVIGPLLTLK